MKSIKIGLLFPRSSIYPAIGFDVADAFREGISHFCNESVEVIAESIGTGASLEEVYACTERMLMRENVNIVVAYIDHLAARKIEPLINAANRLLIVMEPGGTIPETWEASPLSFHLTLDASFANFVTSGTATNAGVSKAAFCSTFYDAGYLSCSAMVERFMEKGGSMAHNCIVPFQYETFDITPLAEAIDTYNINGVLAHLSKESGSAFFKAYVDARLNEKVNLFYASPFVFEEQFLDELPFPFGGIKGCVPWGRHLDTEENKAFMTIMDDKLSKLGNCFSALAWDTALFTSLAIKALAENNNNAAKAAKALEGTILAGTRGTMKLDSNTNYILAPLYDATIIAGDDGMSRLLLGDVIDTSGEWEQFTTRSISDTHSRWLNTYLCTT